MTILGVFVAGVLVGAVLAALICLNNVKQATKLRDQAVAAAKAAGAKL